MKARRAAVAAVLLGAVLSSLLPQQAIAVTAEASQSQDQSTSAGQQTAEVEENGEDEQQTEEEKSAEAPQQPQQEQQDEALSNVVAFSQGGRRARVSTGAGAGANPVVKVFQLLTDLQAKVIAEGESVQKVYDEYSSWCEARSRELHQEMESSRAGVNALRGIIEKATDTIESKHISIQELAAKISSDEADLKEAADLRQQEGATFAEGEKQVSDTIDALERAIAILDRDIKSQGSGGDTTSASLVQSDSAEKLVSVLSALVTAQGIGSSSAQTLTALLQTVARAKSGAKSEDEDGNDEEGDESSDEASSEQSTAADVSPGAPEAAIYESRSGSIIDTLESLLEKTQAQLEALRTEEATKSQNFKLLKLSLEGKATAAKKELDQAKRELAEAGETQAEAKGNLAHAQADLVEAGKQLDKAHHSCMSKAADFEDEVKSRNEELKAIGQAKKIVANVVDGTEDHVYGQSVLSFVQVRQRETATVRELQAVHHVKKLARKLQTHALVQLASRLESVLRSGRRSEQDAFGKVKQLISDMIEALKHQGNEEITRKDYCDKELASATAKSESKRALIDKLTTKMDQTGSRSTKLLAEVSRIEEELAELGKAQVDMDKIRMQEKENNGKAKTDMEAGVGGIQMAIKVLREYYAKSDKAHDSQETASSMVIGLLEVVESDFSKALDQLVQQEEDAQRAYSAMTKENEIARAKKNQAMQYKNQQIKAFNKALAEVGQDREGQQAQMDALSEYLARLKEQCVAKADTFEERDQRRKQEIAGLEQALAILNGETMLAQKAPSRQPLVVVLAQEGSTRHRRLRGSR